MFIYLFFSQLIEPLLSSSLPLPIPSQMEELLFSSVQRGDIDSVRKLLQTKGEGFVLDINSKNSEQRTVLDLACRMGQFEIMKLLMEEEGIDVNLANGHGASPFAVACGYGHLEIVEYLFEDERVDVKGMTKDLASPFFLACQEGHLNVVDYLFKKRIYDVNGLDRDGQTPFMMACWIGHSKIVKYLMETNEVTMDHVKDVDQSPIYLACQNGFTDIVKLLLEDEKVDINLPSSDNATPFFVACQNGHYELVKFLLSLSKEVKIDTKWGAQGLTPLEQAKIMITLSRREWESSDLATSQRQKNCALIVQLLEKFQSNKEETKFELRREQGFTAQEAAVIFSTIVLITDGYLDFKRNS